MKKVIIFGISELASVNHYYLTQDSDYQIAAFTVDKEFIEEESMCCLPILPFENIETIYPPGDYLMAMPLGFRKLNRFRMEKYRQAKAKGYEFVNYVSSNATVPKELIMGENSFVYENCIVGPFTKIGNNVIINPGCCIGHHCLIGDHCWMSSHAVVLGGVNMGPFSVLGANSTITDGVAVGAECIIGAGVTITKDTVDKGFYINKPPELVRKRSDELSAVLTWPVR